MKRFTKLAAIVMSLLMLCSMAGCSSSDIDYANTVAATYGSENIYMDEAVFFLRYQQWTEEAYYWDMYTTYFGYDDMWVVPADSEGNITMEDYLKEYVMSQLIQTRVLIDHADEYGAALTDAEKTKVSEAVDATYENLAEEFFNYVTISEEALQAALEKNAVANKVYEAVRQSTQVEVTDAECQMYTIQYALLGDVTDDSENVTITAEDLAADVKAQLEAGSDFEAVGELNDFSVSETSYLKADDSNTSELFLYTVMMTEGQIESWQSGENWYVVKCVSELDEEATEEKRAEVEDEKREEYFDTVYEEWAAAAQSWDVKKAYENYTIISGEEIYVALES